MEEQTTFARGVTLQAKTPENLRTGDSEVRGQFTAAARAFGTFGSVSLLNPSAEECGIHALKPRGAPSRGAARAISAVAVVPGTNPVGSYKYAAFKYPGDIDLFEGLVACCTTNDARVHAAGAIRGVAGRIAKDPSIIFTDFKAGYDERYRIYIGHIDENRMDVADYDGPLVRRDIAALWESGLLTEKEMETLTDLAVDDPGAEEYTLLAEALRRHWIVRWTLSELLRGYKILPGALRLYLDTALMSGSIVKLDTVAPVDGRYVEVSDWFLVARRDARGNLLPLSSELGDYEQSLLSDVLKYTEPGHENYLKAAKRAWMVLAFRGDNCALDVLAPLFSSRAALLSQVAADFETALLLIEGGYRHDAEYLARALAGAARRAKEAGSICPIRTTNATEIRESRDCIGAEVNQLTKSWLDSKRIDLRALGSVTE